MTAIISAIISLLASPMFTDVISGLGRHILTAVGGALAAKGLLSADVLNQFIGAGMAMFGTVWSMWTKTLGPNA